MSLVDLTRATRTQPKGTGKKLEQDKKLQELDRLAASVAPPAPPTPPPAAPAMPPAAPPVPQFAWGTDPFDPWAMEETISRPQYISAPAAPFAPYVNEWAAPSAASLDDSGNWWDEAAQGWRDPNSGMLWNGVGWGDAAPAPIGIDEAHFQQQPQGDFYPDFSAELDRAYLQHAAVPQSPQEAQQNFDWDTPKLNPENVGKSGGGWWDEIDQYVLKPLDYVSELGADTAPIWWGNALTQTAMAPYNAFEDWEEKHDIPYYNAPDFEGAPAPADSFARTKENLTDYSGTVEDFRNRPLSQQLLYGSIYDASAVLPGIGYGDEIASGFGTLGRKLGNAASPSSLSDFAERSARLQAPPLSYDEQMIRGAVDPFTGRPLGPQPILGASDEMFEIPATALPDETPTISQIMNGEAPPQRWQPEFGVKESAEGSFGVGSTPGGRKPVPGQGNTQIQPDVPSWRLPDPDRLRGASESQRIAAKDFRKIYLAKEEQLRISGAITGEISDGRKLQAARINSAREAAQNAGLEGRDAADFVRENATGTLRETRADIPASVMDEVDWMYATIDKAYPTSAFDYLSAEAALTEALTTGNLEPRQLDILKAVFGDEMPDVERIAAQAGGRASSEATTIPMDLGGLTKPGEPPMIGEGNKLVLPERPTNPLDTPGPALPADSLKSRNQLMQDFRAASLEADDAERAAFGTTKHNWTPPKGSGGRELAWEKFTSGHRWEEVEPGKWKWVRTSQSAADGTAATTAGGLRSKADDLQRQVDAAQAKLDFGPGTSGIDSAGPAMRETKDLATARPDLVLLGQSPADVDMGIAASARADKGVIAARPPKVTTKDKLGRIALQATGIPRAVKAGGELSASFRQGGILGPRHPKAWAKSFKAQVDSYAKQENFDTLMAEIDASEYRLHEEKAGLFQAHRAGTDLNQREEGFLFSWMNKNVPGKLASANLLKKGERGYIAMLDTLRHEVFVGKMKAWAKEGYAPSEKDMKRLAEFINHATGRGTGEFLDKHGGLASIPLFAPRYYLSRPQAIWDLVTAPPAVRKEAAQSLGMWVGSLATIYGLGELAEEAGIWDGDVEFGPLKAGFGKIAVGGYSLDPTGGAAGEIKNLVQIAKGGYEDGDGAFWEKSREDLVGGYLRGKASPNGALVYDLLSGEDYMGNKVNFNTLDGAKQAAFNTFGNLFAEDVYRVLKEEFGGGDFSPTDALTAVTATLGAFFGMSSGLRDDTFQSKKEDAYSRWAKENGASSTNWDDASVLDKTLFEKQNAEIAVNPDSPLGAIKSEYANRQTALEGQFQAGAIPTLGEYNQTRKNNATEARGRYEEATKDMPDKPLADEVYQSYLDIFDVATDPATGYFDPEKFAQAEAEWERENPKEYVEAVALARNDGPVEKERRSAIKRLADDGYFMGDENSMPRYMGMVSDASEEDITDLRNQVTLAGKDPEYAVFEDFAQRALIYLGDKDVDTMVIVDVINSGKKKFQDIDFVMYKLDHPDLLIWLDDTATWDIIQKNQKP